MTKYTGPIQYTEDDRVFNKQFLFIKIDCSVDSAVSVVTDLCGSFIRMVREWIDAQRIFLVEKKMQGADLAQIGAEYANR